MREIIRTPNHILSTPANEVKEVNEQVSRLIDEMWLTLDKKGVGLAAPQIGESIRLAIIGFEPTDQQLKKDPKTLRIPKIVIINPKIVWKSKEKSTEKEGCLSVEKIEVNISRNKKIHLEYCDTDLKQHKMKAKGYLARVIQHEIDHLNGKLITDYL